MHCSVKRKNCAILQNTFFTRGGGHSWGSFKKFNVFGGQEENVSSKKISPPPCDFINERSLRRSSSTEAEDRFLSNFLIDYFGLVQFREKVILTMVSGGSFF